jgi:hypothetical protein
MHITMPLMAWPWTFRGLASRCAATVYFHVFFRGHNGAATSHPHLRDDRQKLSKSTFITAKLSLEIVLRFFFMLSSSILSTHLAQTVVITKCSRKIVSIEPQLMPIESAICSILTHLFCIINVFTARMFSGVTTSQGLPLRGSSSTVPSTLKLCGSIFNSCLR